MKVADPDWLNEVGVKTKFDSDSDSDSESGISSTNDPSSCSSACINTDSCSGSSFCSNTNAIDDETKTQPCSRLSVKRKVGVDDYTDDEDDNDSTVSVGMESPIAKRVHFNLSRSASPAIVCDSDDDEEDHNVEDDYEESDYEVVSC